MKFLFDLDGTVTREELLPRIAREIGYEREITQLTRLTISGAIPFETSFTRRVEILRQVPVSRVREITGSIEIDPHIAEFIKTRPGQCAVVTGNLDVWVEGLRSRLGIPFYSSRADVSNDRITRLVSILDKRDAAIAIQGPCCAIGDGYNDVPLFETATYGVAFGGVHSPAPGLLDVATHAVYESRTLCRLLSQLS